MILQREQRHKPLSNLFECCNPQCLIVLMALNLLRVSVWRHCIYHLARPNEQQEILKPLNLNNVTPNHFTQKQSES